MAMADNTKSTVRIEPDRRQLAGVYAAFKKMDDNSKTLLKQEVTSISAWSAGEIKASASRSPFPAQAEKVALTIRANKDRIPNVTIGGNKKVTENRTEAGVLVFGAEFGGPSPFANGGRRFPYRSPRQGRGNTGYWIFPTLKSIQPEITHRWKNAVERFIQNPWSQNG